MENCVEDIFWNLKKETRGSMSSVQLWIFRISSVNCSVLCHYCMRASERLDWKHQPPERDSHVFMEWGSASCWLGTSQVTNFEKPPKHWSIKGAAFSSQLCVFVAEPLLLKCNHSNLLLWFPIEGISSLSFPERNLWLFGVSHPLPLPWCLQTADTGFSVLYVVSIFLGWNCYFPKKLISEDLRPLLCYERLEDDISSITANHKSFTMVLNVRSVSSVPAYLPFWYEQMFNFDMRPD